jgi:hypothetical protein
VAGSYQRSNEPSGSVKGGKFLKKVERLSTSQERFCSFEIVSLITHRTEEMLQTKFIDINEKYVFTKVIHIFIIYIYIAHKNERKIRVHVFPYKVFAIFYTSLTFTCYRETYCCKVAHTAHLPYLLLVLR